MPALVRSLALASLLAFSLTLQAAGVPTADTAIADRLRTTGLESNTAFRLLGELTAVAPHRLSGSPGAQKAVELTMRMMDSLGFQQVHAETVMVPHWERGPRESALLLLPGLRRKPLRLSICALGGSIATPKGGIEAGVVEVKSFDELKSIGDAAKGKIVFFNRPMDPTLLNTFQAYSGAVDQRARGAVAAAEAGGVAALVRSMTLAHDRVPHTGVMSYKEGVLQVPAAAVSTIDADTLSSLLKRNPALRIRLRLTCRTLPDAPSANVMGQITGTERPQDIIVVSGHLDCWDKGQGAHDNGGGSIQAIEVLRLMKDLGIRPRRTIRAVLFMNEENGARGGKGYVVARERAGEHPVAAIESDRGSFSPVGFSVQGDSSLYNRVIQWKPLFERLQAGVIEPGHSGTDVGPLVATGVPGFGLSVENQRYFDYHHSDNDTIDKVNPRELELGAVCEALLCYLISERGL